MNRLVILAAMFLLSGCSFWGASDVTPQLFLNIKASANINPNVEGLPSPLEVRVYQMTDSQAFSQADFIQLYNDAQGVLKAELLLTRELASVIPNEERQVVMPLAAGTKYIGVIAGFADYREAKNKTIYQPLVVGSAVLNIELDGVNLSVTGDEE
ncbi:type VI secretion system protein VasD [Vibrio crassostreae]|uniref:Lipoprotein n=2 Tax=Vibrio TaxID=662 RepID=A0A4R2FTV4_9VIBR|nr:MULTISPECIES: type VI secretion system lipoprotein TssJ [Vibrio]APB62074.1 putative Lipoprotein [Vibrio crassostreae]MDH5922638.1 type VI secretion system lipoprotein TssJ [Vibrio splendidus]MDH5938487.1 type VI secretion system lipoprotein TssJ [Vibrio splendidus]MDH5951852.1 type VI secretion system lipoprotein TssJ [Vibrio crassostreae]NOH77149.1 type VI secretion system lipoprotein TssJ [Vibrio crassostreae]